MVVFFSFSFLLIDSVLCFLRARNKYSSDGISLSFLPLFYWLLYVQYARSEPPQTRHGFTLVIYQNLSTETVSFRLDLKWNVITSTS